MNQRTVYAPAKLVGEKLKHTFDWTPQLGSGAEADTLTATPPTFEADQDVPVTIIETEEGVTSFTVGEGGMPGFNLAVLFTVTTAGGQKLQARVVVPITSR